MLRAMDIYKERYIKNKYTHTTDSKRDKQKLRETSHRHIGRTPEFLRVKDFSSWIYETLSNLNDKKQLCLQSIYIDR
jgi:hypothetical protein